MGTRRERIIEVLLSSGVPLTVEAIIEAAGLDMKPRDVYEELEHIRKTLRRQGIKLTMVPPECRKCGYVFKDREKLSKPSRCPRCKSERISPPLFYVTR